MSHVELLTVAACAGAIASGVLLWLLGRWLDPSRPR